MERKEPERMTYSQYMSPQASFHILYTPVSGTTGLHWHEFYEVSCIVAGSGVNHVNGTPVPVGRGSLFLLTPADFHELTADSDSELLLYNVIFSDELLDDEMRGLLFHDKRTLMTDLAGARAEAIIAEFVRMLNEENRPQVGYHRLIRGALERILIELVRACRSGREEEPELERGNPNAPIRKALLYLEHHFREEITLAEAARHVNLAPNYFSGLFKKSVGIPFKMYLQNTRIQFAKALLSVSDLSVTDVCYSSGFNTLSHFERVFKERMGCAPRHYRSLIMERRGMGTESALEPQADR